jgi:hypothetical protein
MAELNGTHVANRLDKLSGVSDLRKAGVAEPAVQSVEAVLETLDDIAIRLDRIEKSTPAASPIRQHASADLDAEVVRMSPDEKAELAIKIAQSAKKGWPQ